VTRTTLRALVVSTGVLVLSLVAGPEAYAQPVNDDFANATIISALPFGDSSDNSPATTEPSEPQFCEFSPRTIWYSFTPSADAVLEADMMGSSFIDTVLNVYRATGPGFDGLSFLTCAPHLGSLKFVADAGITYYLQAGDAGISGAGGPLRVNLQEVPSPPNDDFADATIISSQPFVSDLVDTSAATREADEPVASCSAGLDPDRTVWYSFTPSESGSVSARIDNPSTAAGAFTGDSLASLTEVGCSHFGDPLTFRAEAATTYYLQVSTLFGFLGQTLHLSLDVAPSPVAAFSFFPSDPSIVDTIGFSDNSFDPGRVGFEAWEWDFGDGSTGTGCCVAHRYAEDGDYTVQLTVTTFDGRTALTSQVVHVRTHDVAIDRFLAPMVGSAGQTRKITVGISTHLSPEDVQVQLFRGIPGGFVPVGTLTQHVSIRPGNRTTMFAFSYTFTSEDAVLGEITFKAVATIVNARDALPADNEAIAPPTIVM
jgi:chitodextrinase